MDDKLLELKNMSGRKDLSLNTSLNSEGDDFMPEFTAKVKKAQQTLEKIKDNSQRMQEMQEKYSRATTSQQEKDLSRELDQIMMQNQQYSMQLKEVMSGISKDVEISKSQQPDEPETQMKITQQGALSIKVSDVLRVSQQVQVDYKASVREKMTRQTKHLDSTLSNEQVEEICNDPQKAEQLFQEKLYGQASVQMQNAVSDIQDKYKDIRKLEQSVQLVYQLIVDMALLVHTQGQMLDNIEMSLGSAKGYVGKAEKKLIEAKDDHQSARKKMCCLMLVGVIVIAIIVVPSVTMSKS